MRDLERSQARGALAREWPYIFCMLFVVLTLGPHMALRRDREVGPQRAGQSRAAERRIEQLTSGPRPPLSIVLERLTWALVLVSCIWVLFAGAYYKRVFRQAALPSARWHEWDVIKILFVFFFLAIASGFVMPADGLGGALAAQSLAMLLTVLAALEVIRLRGQDPADALGLRLRGFARHVVPGLAAFFVFLPVLNVFTHVWKRSLQQVMGNNIRVSQELVTELTLTQSPEVMAWIVITAVLVAPVAEELFFRGFLYGLLRRRVRPAVAILAGGVLFGLFHAPLTAAVPMCLFGAFLCYIYEKTASLTIPIAIHFLFNLSQVALMMSYKFSF